MTRISLKHVNAFRDRNGLMRHYFRKPGHKNVPLPGKPGSAEFMDAYSAALAGHLRIEIGAPRAKPGSVAATVGKYLRSTAFSNLAPETQRTRRNILERFREAHGEKSLANLKRDRVQNMVSAKATTPSAARNFLNTLRALMVFAIDEGICTENPTLGVKRVKIRTTGYRAWSDDDIAAFETTHPLGSRARLALALLLDTGQRRSDVVRMGPQHIDGDVIVVRQQKTGTVLAIPLRPSLREAINAAPSGHLTFLTTSNGKPFTSAGFTNWFRDVCNEAGLPKGTSAHGLRKAACRRLAEAGCSASEIAAISGHVSLREIERYTKSADQKRMARSAINRLRGTS